MNILSNERLKKRTDAGIVPEIIKPAPLRSAIDSEILLFHPRFKAQLTGKAEAQHTRIYPPLPDQYPVGKSGNTKGHPGGLAPAPGLLAHPPQ